MYQNVIKQCVFPSEGDHVYLQMFRYGNIVFLTVTLLAMRTFTFLTPLSLLVPLSFLKLPA